jgi:mannose-6-phosphate isomerase-like protein (cupin superfamily)
MIPPEQPLHDLALSYFLGELPPLEAQRLEQRALTDPTLAAEINALQTTAEGLALTAATPPPPYLRGRILDVIAELAKEERLDLNQLPRISRHSDARLWFQSVKELAPNDTMDGIPMYLLSYTPHLQQVLLWMDESLEENPHAENEFTESFLILSGTCHCEFGSQSFDLKAGDFVEVPAGTAHCIRNTTPGAPVIAIVQRCLAA